MRTLDLSVAKPLTAALPKIESRWGSDRGGRPWRRKRQRILLRDRYTCACGAQATEVDHIVPLSQGGADDDSNLRSICSPCHQAKTQRESQGGR